MGWAARKNKQKKTKPFTLAKENAIVHKWHNKPEWERIQETLVDFHGRNTLAEIEGIKKQIQTPFQKARAIILEAVFDIAILDCYDESGDDEYLELNEKIKKAAKDLVKAESNDSLHAPLIWLFIPKDYHGILDMAFDGVGDWRA